MRCKRGWQGPASLLAYQLKLNPTLRFCQALSQKGRPLVELRENRARGRQPPIRVRHRLQCWLGEWEYAAEGAMAIANGRNRNHLRGSLTREQFRPMILFTAISEQKGNLVLRARDGRITSPRLEGFNGGMDAARAPGELGRLRRTGSGGESNRRRLLPMSRNAELYHNQHRESGHSRGSRTGARQRQDFWSPGGGSGPCGDMECADPLTLPGRRKPALRAARPVCSCGESLRLARRRTEAATPKGPGSCRECVVSNAGKPPGGVPVAEVREEINHCSAERP